jgi:predicted amidohydrolase
MALEQTGMGPAPSIWKAAPRQQAFQRGHKHAMDAASASAASFHRCRTDVHEISERRIATTSSVAVAQQCGDCDARGESVGPAPPRNSGDARRA